MKSKGTLYHKEMVSPHGSVRFIERPLSKKDKLRRAFGAGMTSISLALFLYSYGPVVSSQLSFTPSQVAPQAQIVTTVNAKDSNIQNDDMSQFQIDIPFLNTTAAVIPDVDPANEGEYDQALSEGVAQAKGTGVPGSGNRIFLFAHSTNSPIFIERYNAIFYNLERIPYGEKIEIDYHGKQYFYTVTDKKIVSAIDTSWLSPQSGEELILQTCWPAGTNWKRLLVFAKPIAI